jgi:hypothetical protein
MVLWSYSVLQLLQRKQSKSVTTLVRENVESGLYVVQTSGSTAIGLTSTPPLTSTPSQPASSESSKGLTTLKRAGIGGGIAGAVLLVALGGALAYIVRLRRKIGLRADYDNISPQGGDTPGTYPAHKEGSSVTYYAHEVNTGISELPAGREIPELPVSKEACELPT